MTKILAEYRNPGQEPYWAEREVNIIDGFPQAYPSTIGLGCTWTGNWKVLS